MITNESGWLQRVIPEPLDDAKNHRRLEAALVGLLRVADYTRSLILVNVSQVSEMTQVYRERQEWQQLFENATARADKGDALLREIAAARQQLEDKLVEMLDSRDLWRERCLVLESKLKLVEAGQA